MELIERLPDPIKHVLIASTACALELDVTIWLVGGVVRDLLRNAELGRDIDLAVSGNTATLAAKIAAALDGNVCAVHAAFGTATIEANGLVIDLAGTRREHYPYPAALPLVEPAPIETDLQRRDFSINALAIELALVDHQLQARAFLDPFNGRSDLAAARLRLLHDTSLRDDPTRLLRGVRLATRMDLHPDEATRRQINAAVETGLLEQLSRERILAELCLALDEPDPAATLHTADAWNVTPQLLPGLAWSPALAERCARFAEQHGQSAAAHRLVYTGLFLIDCDALVHTTLRERYPLPANVDRLVQQLEGAKAVASAIADEQKPSTLDRLLRPFDEETLIILRDTFKGTIQAQVTQYMTELRHKRPLLNGHELQKLGVMPGPQIGSILKELRAARLDGVITNRMEAEEWVRQYLSEGT
jgi:tRNA nucleotidyltransferase (CCA-adding enzyme)